MWEKEDADSEARNRNSGSSCVTGEAGLSEKLALDRGVKDESFMTLNLEFDWEDNNNNDKKTSCESLRTLDLTEEGFEMQDTVGGHKEEMVKTPRNKVIERATSLAESSDSEVDSFVVEESSPLVRA